MTTPSPRPGGFFLGNTGPSGTFLQQLLDEINGKGSPTVRRNTGSPQGTSGSQASSRNSGKASPSVWVGGASIARDACDNLRAADDARLRKISIHGTDGAPAIRRTLPRLETLRPHTRSASSVNTLKRCGQNDSHTSKAAKNEALSGSPRDTTCIAPLRIRPTLNGLRLPSSNFGTQSRRSVNAIAGADSPLIIRDTDSNITSTPSPSEASTSALTEASSEATTVFDSHPPSRQASSSISPGKRARLPDAEPVMLSKKMRIMTLPECQSLTSAQSEVSTSATLGSIGGDNPFLILIPTFVERAPAPPRLTSHIQAHTLPELSSFRPGVASPQGQPQPCTPVRTSACKSPMSKHDESPASADTPIYARPLHLIDTDISVYKQAHGEEWVDNSLCLYCFREGGSFNRILTHGYEVCGREEALEHHYWEPALNPYT